MGGARRLKLDGSIPNQLARAADAAVALERNGFDGGWKAEASHDPFLPLLLAAGTRRDLSLAPTSR
ncbi:oxidoreductase [Mycobacterium tuberculosis]|nr:oxidoreductase [Mycobacterium tuberculosis]